MSVFDDAAERRRAYMREYFRRPDVREKKRLYMRERTRKFKYGITHAEFDELFEKQNRRCAACFTADFGKKGPCLDHDHATGHVRGILCDPCNRTLGHARECPSRLFGLMEYLRMTWPDDPVLDSYEEEKIEAAS